MRALKTLTILTLALAGSAFVHGSTAHAADPELDAARAALDEILLEERRMVARAKAVHALADLKTEAAAKSYVEYLEMLSGHTATLEVESEKTHVQYEPYSGYTFKDPKAWDIKARLRKKMDELDEVIQSHSVVLLAFGTGATRFADGRALKALERGAAAGTFPHTRRTLTHGLLRNPLVVPAAFGKKMLKDKDATVRLVALEGLTERKDPETLELGVKALKSKGWPHRQAAGRLLGELEDVRAVAPLINAMGAEEGRLVEVYAEALQKITKQEIGPFVESWKIWYDDNKEKLAAQGARAATVRVGVKPTKAALDYYGIKTRSRRIVFLIDISGSMEEVIGKPEMQDVTGEKEENFHGKKIDIAKKMLKQAVRNLPDDVYFNIITFNHAVTAFTKTALEATQANKNKAYVMINDLEPRGATYTYGALEMVFKMAGRGVSDKAYDPGVDTIFLLSDGAPTDDNDKKAQPMEPDKILKQTAEWNSLKRVQIHTIAIDPRVGRGAFIKLMKGLAHQHHGTYTEIGDGSK